jgi:hypothetical protein
MKINPVAIQSYQQVDRQERPVQRPADNSPQAARESVTIKPQSETERSRMAVNATGVNYAENLTSEERQALELLFGKFRDSGRFGNSYRASGEEATQDSHLGQVLDIKV